MGIDTSAINSLEFFQCKSTLLKSFFITNLYTEIKHIQQFKYMGIILTEDRMCDTEYRSHIERVKYLFQTLYKVLITMKSLIQKNNAELLRTSRPSMRQ